MLPEISQLPTEFQHVFARMSRTLAAPLAGYQVSVLTGADTALS